MAIILGKKPIIETKQYEDYAVGLALPIQINGVAFKQNYTEIEQLKSNIKNLLLTKRGERIMNPLFGAGVETVLFEPITEEFEDALPFVGLATVTLALLSVYGTIKGSFVENKEEVQKYNLAVIKSIDNCLLSKKDIMDILIMMLLGKQTNYVLYWLLKIKYGLV